MNNNSNYRIILSSASPRRKQLLEMLDIPFDVRIIKDIKEDYPKSLPVNEVAPYISKKKALAYKSIIAEDELVITADTIVVCDNQILGKPNDEQNAKDMLNMLSNKKHNVITGVSLTTKDKQRTFSANTEVCFRSLTQNEINYYVDKYKPLDKAGAYGIQEWIGCIGCVCIKGSFFNVMGLPIHQLYMELEKFFAI